MILLVVFPTRIFFKPCHRCHLATLLENQRVTCGKEVTRVTRNGVFALKMSEKTLLLAKP